MKLIKKQTGYTILETLIVLTVTGVLFTTTALLIQGQVEKTRYQDSMRQIQQTVQQAIKDTENGYFPGATGNDTAGTVLAGKRIYFCTDAPDPNDDENSRQPCTAGKSMIRVENIYADSGGSLDTDVELSNGKETYITYPGSINYKYHHKSNGTYPRESTGFAVMFKNFSTTDYGSQTTSLYEAYIDDNNITTRSEDEWTKDRTPLYWNQGKRICFDGYKKGSLIIGRNGSTNVEMNLDDPECIH
ncbi:MAG TPA: type II secretion system protein [Candidatus Saccharibacteria bacterium]|nr:type II secretion system protein [Candidatus Saccharibacteria bacterium]MCB9817409.1 type II secretion system protein [Candidatus Nomurabacteria bacterium]HPD98789.1 type II secretion system protein [Candidatus Saccharibacteria bacterium]HPR10589.1 type II secretion system protein [Candidatus Saccharibacteria bacterium]